MNTEFLYSERLPPTSWLEAPRYSSQFGTKASGLLLLPRPWVPPYILISCEESARIAAEKNHSSTLGEDVVEILRQISAPARKVIVRSSVAGESIWDRGKYYSEVVALDETNWSAILRASISRVVSSAPGKRCATIIQRYVAPAARGEFGNLLRISKTREQWELSNENDGRVHRSRYNSQRDIAADPKSSLVHQRSLTQERLFGTISAWINSYLLLGQNARVNCEWVASTDTTYIVQIDEETEDTFGVNPFHLRIGRFHEPACGHGTLLRAPTADDIASWDKLTVVEELAEANQTEKPKLFVMPLADIEARAESLSSKQLAQDFLDQIGPDKIVVRTSVRSNREKVTNLPRSEGMTPDEAVAWIEDTFKKLKQDGNRVEDLAFVAHRFIAARAAAWARAEPNGASVEIHCLWGLPDALQFCPYDIWEVHLPTSTAVEYPEYKSNMLLAEDDGRWKYVRIKNELGRSLCISRGEALEIASRSAAIATRLGRPIHVMWFVGCRNPSGGEFNLPWYWIGAEESQRNVDRSTYETMEVASRADLHALLEFSGSAHRLAVELRPVEQPLMRDEKFIASVGERARQLGVPVVLSGSTLAHAYYVLRRTGCTVVARGEKVHSRVRKGAAFGKLVRDKIPKRIAGRGEAETTVAVPGEIKKGFLLGKLFEEALEVRSARQAELLGELADLYEVVVAIIESEGFDLESVQSSAAKKREKSGGFEQGLVLIQTGILGRDRETLPASARQIPNVLWRRVSDYAVEIPFTVFGFLGLDQPRPVSIDAHGLQLTLTLKPDRLLIEVGSQNQQLDFELTDHGDPSSGGE